MSMNTPMKADDVLRQYLLGALPPESLDAVEQRLFSDDRVFWERLSLVEEQLVDDYVWGRMEFEDRERFENGFLTTSERHARVEFARALRDYVERREYQRNRVWRWLTGPMAASTPGWAVAVAAVLLLAVGPAITWRLAVSRVPQGVISLWVAPGQVRDIDRGLARLQVGPNCQMVRLLLETVPAPYSSYSARLFNVTGDEFEVWSQHRLQAGPVDGKLAVTLMLPCGVLADGDYYVRSQGVTVGRGTVNLEKYSFRVLRP